MSYGMVILLVLVISKKIGRKFYIKKDEQNGILDSKSDEGIFLGYSTRSKAYKCLK